MSVISAIAAAAALLVVLWCLLLRPRRNHPGWDALAHFRYAHRGLHSREDHIPENSLSAFRAAVEAGFGAELDVHLMADGRLAVVHDSNLSRVCGADVWVEDLTAADLKLYPLLGSRESIPLLEEVLPLFTGKSPLIVELKVARGNAADLTAAAMAVLEGWDGAYCVESFHPGPLFCLKKDWPRVIRGQLSQNFFRGSETGGLPWHLAFLMTNLLTTFLTRPDFIAYSHRDRRAPSLRLMKKLYGVHEVGWTIHSREELLALEREGVVPIFEGFVP